MENKELEEKFWIIEEEISEVIKEHCPDYSEIVKSMKKKQFAIISKLGYNPAE